MELYRPCPNCKNIIIYKTISQKNHADKCNSTCVLCRNRKISNDKKYTGTLEKQCTICKNITIFLSASKYKNSKPDTIYICKSCAVSKSHSGKKVSTETKLKMSNSKKGKSRPQYVKDNLSIKMSGVNNPMYGRTGNKSPMFGKKGYLSPTHGIIPWNKNGNMSDESRKKMRISAIRRMELDINGKLLPSYNSDACKIIDEYGKNNGYNFQHAMKGGEFYIKELGYWVDGYDKEKNIIVEIDESHHFNINGELRRKDIIRQQEIEDFLKCKFIRLKI